MTAFCISLYTSESSRGGSRRKCYVLLESVIYKAVKLFAPGLDSLKSSQLNFTPLALYIPYVSLCGFRMLSNAQIFPRTCCILPECVRVLHFDLSLSVTNSSLIFITKQGCVQSACSLVLCSFSRPLAIWSISNLPPILRISQRSASCRKNGYFNSSAAYDYAALSTRVHVDSLTPSEGAPRAEQAEHWFRIRGQSGIVVLQRSAVIDPA